MNYRYATERPNFADLASGQVFYSLPGHPAFPIRLASEVFQRCQSLRGKAGAAVSVYDPCCGAAYHLSVLAFLHWDSIRQVIASDVDPRAVQLAEHNLSLLTPQGMDRRIREITAMLRLYGKPSHQLAFESADRLRERVNALYRVRPIQQHVFQADALDREALARQLEGFQLDIIFTDLPYGQHSHWQGLSTNPGADLLAALRLHMQPDSVVAIASVKDRKQAVDGFRQVEKLQVGKRQVVFLMTA